MPDKRRRSSSAEASAFADRPRSDKIKRMPFLEINLKESKDLSLIMASSSSSEKKDQKGQRNRSAKEDKKKIFSGKTREDDKGKDCGTGGYSPSEKSQDEGSSGMSSQEDETKLDSEDGNIDVEEEKKEAEEDIPVMLPTFLPTLTRQQGFYDMSTSLRPYTGIEQPQLALG
mmetsp:Transcript_4563/g.6825  ORF Transcript_4563/g.6825 Transcript_4563/m.6825 type:complete len:172 (+) Transcript_4563:73-588(+)